MYHRMTQWIMGSQPEQNTQYYKSVFDKKHHYDDIKSKLGTMRVHGLIECDFRSITINNFIQVTQFLRMEFSKHQYEDFMTDMGEYVRIKLPPYRPPLTINNTENREYLRQINTSTETSGSSDYKTAESELSLIHI